MTNKSSIKIGLVITTVFFTAEHIGEKDFPQ
jgi:hypothetical protein